MWRQHLIVLGSLLLVSFPVYVFDRYLLAPRGGPLPVDMRGLFITAYLSWLAINAGLTTVLLYILKSTRVLAVHLFAGPISILLLVGGFAAWSEFQSYLSSRARNDKLAARAAYADAAKLIAWRLSPSDRHAETVSLVVEFKYSGRFAANVDGRSDDGSQIFSGELKPQIQVHTGDRLEAVLPLTRYRDLPLETTRISLYLFKDTSGTAPEDIFKEYRNVPEASDDGHRFLSPLPPQSNVDAR